MRFIHPWALILLVTLVPAVVWYYFFSKIPRQAVIKYTHVKDLVQKQADLRTRLLGYLSLLPDILKVAAFILLIIVLARPQLGQKFIDRYAEGYDIILAIDCSASMLAPDFNPTRLACAKSVVSKFIKGRKEDRIGLVVYGSESYTQAPLTLDYNMLQQALREVEFGVVDGHSTAIGMAIINSVNRLRHSKAKNKVLILLTDGVNNAGTVDPVTSARIAQAMDIRIYTVGVGSKGQAVFDIDTPEGRMRISSDLDEDVLTQVADITGGQYFRATNPAALEEIYNRIDKLEKSRFKIREYINYNEAFGTSLVIALLLLLSGLLVRDLVLRRAP